MPFSSVKSAMKRGAARGNGNFKRSVDRRNLRCLLNGTALRRRTVEDFSMLLSKILLLKHPFLSVTRIVAIQYFSRSSLSLCKRKQSATLPHEK